MTASLGEERAYHQARVGSASLATSRDESPVTQRHQGDPRAAAQGSVALVSERTSEEPYLERTGSTLTPELASSPAPHPECSLSANAHHSSLSLAADISAS